MKRFLALLSMLVCFTVDAQDQITSNLLTGSWTGTINYTGTGNGYSGGSTPGYNASTNTIYFGYNQGTAAQAIAINNALSGSGVQVNGIQYGATYYNQDYSRGTLSATATVTSNTGATLHQYNHTLGQTTNGWTAWSQTQTFSSSYGLSNVGNASLSFTGKDDRWWAGYYGPMVKDPYLKITYGADPCVSNPQSNASCPGYKTYYNIGDDGYAQVNLPFTFPFYGRNFTTSYMFSNGVVGFLDPTTHWNGFCCDGVNLANNPGSSWNFAIYALQTDLIAANQNAKFYTQSDSSYMKYTWENINEFGTNNLNTFSATIKPTGFIGLNYSQVNVQQHNVTMGIAGDLSQGQYSQSYNGPGSGLSVLNLTTPDVTTGFKFAYTGTEVDLCASNPLSSPTCPGYTLAMCYANPLYDSSCPGYAQAYHDQQCSINALYASDCTGYATAYFDQQCSINPLYNRECPGYATAYFDQQCSINPLYNRDCPGYAAAYKSQQCSLNALYDTDCPGYAAAYKSQQCSLNALYATDCPGYAAAYKSQQCSLNALYATDCPGYAQAYFAQQCEANGLYSQQCPNYATAYAKKQLLEQQNIASSVDIAGTTAKNDPVNTTTSPTTTTTSTTTTQPETTSATSTTSVSPAAVVSVIKAPEPVTSPVQTVQQTQPQSTPPQQQAQKQQEERKTENQVANKIESKMEPGSKGGDSKAGDKDKMKEAVAKVQKEIAKEAKEAKSHEAQVATQGLVVGSMNYVPGFDAYKNALIPDTNALLMARQYQKPVVDNQRAQRRMSGANESKWQEMVDSQYQIGR